MMYTWKIVMDNGREYIIKNNVGSTEEFVNKYLKSNTMNQFPLVEPTNNEGFIADHVLVRGDRISSVEFKS